jgi:hypothetical protein
MPEITRQEKQEKKIYPKQFKMIKNFRGSFSTVLEPFDYTAPARKITFKHADESQSIPAKYALGVFNNNIAMKQIEKGYFTFENLEILLQMAEEEGLFVPTSLFTQKVYTFREIKEILASGDISKVEKLLDNASLKTLSDVKAFTTKMYATLNMSVIAFLEKIYKVSLAPINLDE